MDLTPAFLEPKTVVLLDPTADDGESALDLLEAHDRHLALLVLLHGPGSAALHAFADSESIDLTLAAEIYLDQVAQRIAGADRIIEHVVAGGPDPVLELSHLAAAGDVGRVLVPTSTEPIDVETFRAPPAHQSAPAARRSWPFRSRIPSVFAANPLASQLPASELRCLERNGTVVTVPVGSTILRRGEPGRQCLVVIDGQLEVRRDGKVLADLGAGAVVGELSLLSGQACNADIVTTRDSTVLALDPRAFAAVLDACPVMERQVLKTAVARIEATA